MNWLLDKLADRLAPRIAQRLAARDRHPAGSKKPAAADAVTAAEPQTAAPEGDRTSEPAETHTEPPIHWVQDGDAATRCCGKTLFELQRTDRVTLHEEKRTCRRSARGGAYSVPMKCCGHLRNSHTTQHGCWIAGCMCGPLRMAAVGE